MNEINNIKLKREEKTLENQLMKLPEDRFLVTKNCIRKRYGLNTIISCVIVSVYGVYIIILNNDFLIKRNEIKENIKGQEIEHIVDTLDIDNKNKITAIMVDENNVGKLREKIIKPKTLEFTTEQMKLLADKVAFVYK